VPQVPQAIGARAALRVVPLANWTTEDHLTPTTVRQLTDLTSTIFRATALARTAAKYPAHINELRGSARAAHAAARTSAATAHANSAAYAAALAAAAAADATTYAGSFRAPSTAIAAAAMDAVIATHAAAGYAAYANSAVVTDEIISDVASIQKLNAGRMADLPLWSAGAPGWAKEAWIDLRGSLPSEENWEVWVDWYELRLRGGSLGEDYELVFASVPQEEWVKGPAAANAWIKAHLPKMPDATRPPDLPAPLPGLDAPFAYGWTASQRVAVVAGAQNLPFYPHFSSEEDHQRALEACRVGGERLLKVLRDGRYNARPEYGEALEFYLDDLPKTAGRGNILLANDQVRILHAMFLADAAVLPEGFASRLKSMIANSLR
jgi:hypothetical protein